MSNPNLEATKIPVEILENPEAFIGMYNELVDQVNFLGKYMSFGSFDGNILDDIVIPAGTQVVVSHKLSVVPKYRLILRHIGNVDVVDGTIWNDKQVSFKNNGGSQLTISVLLLKE